MIFEVRSFQVKLILKMGFICFSEKVFATIEEFVDFITLVKGDLDTNEPHWRPIEQYCNPCIADYDVIMHTETLNEDIR